MNNESQMEGATVSLWNPNAAASWSLLFTPVFGAWLHAKNWIALGDEEKAKQSMYWVYGGAVVLILAILLPDKIGRGLGFGYLFGWYFSLAKQQAKHVKENFNNKYHKKSWAKPIGIALAGLFAFIVVSTVAVTYLDSDFQKESALTDVSGVWRASQDGAMVTLKLDGKLKTIEINGKRVPVAVKDFDNVNKILTLVVNNNASMVWSVRQIFDKDGNFTLSLTLQDGTQDDLYFVRNL